MAQIVKKRKSRILQNSPFFEKAVPAILTVLGIITASLILFAAGILLGVINY